MATPAPSIPLSPLNILNIITLPITDKLYTQSVNIVMISVENSFLDININATTGPNSSINFVRTGLSPVSYSGNVNTSLHLGSDIFNKTPFGRKHSITLIINVASNESVHISNLNYKTYKPVNYKTLGIIFLIIFFILNIFM